MIMKSKSDSVGESMGEKWLVFFGTWDFLWSGYEEILRELVIE